MRYPEEIRELLRRVRTRWRNLSVLRASIRASIAVGIVVVLALGVALWTERLPMAFALTGLVAFVAAIGAALWGVAPLRHVPSDARVARFIEERTPALDDRLVSAVHLASDERASSRWPELAGPMLADAAARARDVDVEAVVSSDSLRRTALQALAAAVVLGVVLFAGFGRGRQAYDAAALTLFPSRIALDVTPGNSRVLAGSPVTISARLVGNRAPVDAVVHIGEGERANSVAMTRDPDGAFHLALGPIANPFSYRVVAGGVTSPTYSIRVARPPRVTRIDVDYTYPPSLAQPPRTEEDSGDVYAPAGTDVRLHVSLDRPATGRLSLGDGHDLDLVAESPMVLTGSLTVTDDNSYRVALTDSEGLSNAGDTEYFIRMLLDRPPEVHIVRPASDRSVTPLEEVEVEAQADDDFGIDRMELVYSVRGAAEKSAAMAVPPRATSVTSKRTLYLEDLGVRPGDFVSYYVRARDVTRGSRSNEARSDIFFLEVKPFEQEFAMAQSQSMAGSGYNGSIDDLVNAQKQVVVATWKIDRRAQSAKGARSESDIRTVSRTEADLKTRVEQTSSTFRESTMRDPRKRPGRGTDPTAPQVGQTMPEEDAMAAAAEAMGKAVGSLDALKTGDALPAEMEALDHLLKAQADVKKRQVQRQQAGAGGPGNNNRNYDISTLFDKELQRAQQTNYETPPTTEKRDDPNASLDKLRDLAKRQDELLRRQQELARDRDAMKDEELKRQLEKLTREQNELRQQAEELARQMASPSSQQQSSQDAQGKSGQSGQQSANGKAGGRTDPNGKMRDALDEMRNAASDLRRQDPKQASASGARALDRLREAERQMQAGRPDEKRRAMGDMQLEARQLADAQRQLSAETGKLQNSQNPQSSSRGESPADAARRLAGEQEGLADRLRKLQQGMSGQTAASDAAKELERQHLADRMDKAAREMRGEGREGSKDSKDARSPGVSGEQQEMARALDKLADRLSAASGVKDAESRKLSEQLSRAQDLRERLDRTGREMEKLGQSNDGRGTGSQKAAGETGRAGQGQSGGGSPNGTELARMREEYARQMREVQSLADQMRRDDPNYTRGGEGFTFEGQGMTLSAPGTEAFKQDFAKWEDLRRQATLALERMETSLSKRLKEQEAKDRLAAGVDDAAPPGYEKQVDSYFKALATKKKP